MTFPYSFCFYYKSNNNNMITKEDKARAKQWAKEEKERLKIKEKEEKILERQRLKDEKERLKIQAKDEKALLKKKEKDEKEFIKQRAKEEKAMLKITSKKSSNQPSEKKEKKEIEKDYMQEEIVDDYVPIDDINSDTELECEEYSKKRGRKELVYIITCNSLSGDPDPVLPYVLPPSQHIQQAFPS